MERVQFRLEQLNPPRCPEPQPHCTSHGKLYSISPLPKPKRTADVCFPQHMHGHNFHVLAVGNGKWDGTIVHPNNPQRRDTQLIPGGTQASPGYMVVQINTDNPGGTFHLLLPLMMHHPGARNVLTRCLSLALPLPHRVARLGRPVRQPHGAPGPHHGGADPERHGADVSRLVRLFGAYGGGGDRFRPVRLQRDERKGTRVIISHMLASLLLDLCYSFLSIRLLIMLYDLCLPVT